jgi:hypothetical protein
MDPQFTPCEEFNRLSRHPSVVDTEVDIEVLNVCHCRRVEEVICNAEIHAR